jgi:hypothetical protein
LSTIIPDIWQISREIKEKLPLKDNPPLFLHITEQKDVLSGRTLKRGGSTLIFIILSREALGRKALLQAIKLVLIHEYCHVINTFHPDKVMAKYFPEEYKTWKKIEASGAGVCNNEVFWGTPSFQQFR